MVSLSSVLVKPISTDCQLAKYAPLSLYRCKNSACKGVSVRMEAAVQDFMNLLLDIKIEPSPLLQTFRRRIIDEFDVAMVIKLACSMVQNAGRLWYKLQTVENRQRLQRALFPEGLVYDHENRFGTSISTWPIRVMKGNIDPPNRLAPPRGVEPLFSSPCFTPRKYAFSLVFSEISTCQNHRV